MSAGKHAEFANVYSKKDVERDIAVLNVFYDNKLDIEVTQTLLDELTELGRKIYFFVLYLDDNTTPESYIKNKNKFITDNARNKHLFYLAWNGLIRGDSFKKLLQQKFSLDAFKRVLSAKNIPYLYSGQKRYRGKLVLASDMASLPDGSPRLEGRLLDDGSGRKMREKIVWFPNKKAMPVYPEGYVPINQTHLFLIRHGRSEHDSGGENPKFVGSGYWDTWQGNKRISGSVHNNLHEEGKVKAQNLGEDFKIAVDILERENVPLWRKEDKVTVFGSESVNTKQTAENFLKASGYLDIDFKEIFGLNSQKYGALTHKYKNEINEQILDVTDSTFWGKERSEQLKKIKAMFKNRFFHYPEGETLIEADWRIGYSFVGLLKSNIGKRVLLVDHSGALRVFAAIIKSLDFADYCGLKESQDSIIAMCYQNGKNVRYDYLQKNNFPLR